MTFGLFFDSICPSMENNFIKITNAAYKVLDFFPDSDPLKNKAKEKVLAILENLTLISDASGWVSLKKEKASAQLMDDIKVLESYLKLGKYQGWIDNVNFLIITKEYNQIKSEVNPPRGLVRQSLEIALTPDKEDEKLLQEPAPKITTTPKINQVDQGYSQRQRKILEILKERGKVQVSGIIKELPNITKRTIRRDLDDLLKRGEIMRIGEFNQVFYVISENRDKSTEKPLDLDRTRTLS